MLTDADLDTIRRLIDERIAGIRPDLDGAKGMPVALGGEPIIPSKKRVKIGSSTLLRDQTAEAPPCES